MTLEDEPLRSVWYWGRAEKQLQKNEEAGPKWKWCSVVDVFGGESKVQCCKEQYCIGTWKVRSKNQGKLDMVKQEMTTVKIDIQDVCFVKKTHWSEQKPFFNNPGDDSTHGPRQMLNTETRLCSLQLKIEKQNIVSKNKIWT